MSEPYRFPMGGNPACPVCGLLAGEVVFATFPSSPPRALGPESAAIVLELHRRTDHPTPDEAAEDAERAEYEADVNELREIVAANAALRLALENFASLGLSRAQVTALAEPVGVVRDGEA